MKAEKKILYDGQASGNSPLSDILSGTMGGIAQVVVGHPLDTVKVRMQSAGSTASFGRTLVTGLKAGNLYAGAVSPLLGAMLHNATLFYVNGATRQFLYDPAVQRPVRDAFIAGATVGLAATIVETPIDLVKCKLQATNQYANVFVAVRQLFSKFGVRGLWQGVGATGLRNVPCFSAYFGCNTVAKEFFLARNNGAPLQLYQMFLSGAAAGFGFWGVLYPLDVVKSRMQVQASEMSERKYKSVIHCFRTLYKEEGAQVFWRAYTPALVRALFVNGAVFLAFELSTRKIREMRSKQ